MLLLLMAAVYISTVMLLCLKLKSAIQNEHKPAMLHWVLLVGIIIFGAWLRFEKVQHSFKVFYVGYEVYNTAQMISEHNYVSNCNAGNIEQCEERATPLYASGLPAIAALPLKAAKEPSPEILFKTNAFLGTCAIPIIFLLVYASSRRMRAALTSAFLMAMLPLHLILSGNATTEVIGFLFLGITLLFLVLYLREADSISGAGLAISCSAAVSASSGNLWLCVLILIVTAWRRPQGWKTLVATCCGLLGIGLFTLLSPSVYGSETAWKAAGLPMLLIANARYLMTNHLASVVFTIPATAGAIFLVRRAGHGAWATLILGAALLFNALSGVAYQSGDFVRYMLPAMLPLVFYFGLAFDWICERINNAPLQNALTAFIITFLFVSAFNKSMIQLRPFMEDQDLFLSTHLRDLDPECSIFSPNPAISMTYAKNRSYDMSTLLDNDFIKSHRECKVMIFEVFCATEGVETCTQIVRRYRPQLIHGEDIFGYYRVEISRLSEDGQKQVDED